jgi:hypothetical protein
MFAGSLFSVLTISTTILTFSETFFGSIFPGGAMKGPAKPSLWEAGDAIEYIGEPSLQIYIT